MKAKRVSIIVLDIFGLEQKTAESSFMSEMWK